MHEIQPSMQTNIENDKSPVGGASPSKSTGPGADKARLLPTALMGPAQQGREPCPIILPRIAIGVSVAPIVPALPAALAVAAPPRAPGHRPTLVLTPVTNDGQREETMEHQQRP